MLRALASNLMVKFTANGQIWSLETYWCLIFEFLQMTKEVQWFVWRIMSEYLSGRWLKRNKLVSQFSLLKPFYDTYFVNEFWKQTVDSANTPSVKTVLHNNTNMLLKNNSGKDFGTREGMPFSDGFCLIFPIIILYATPWWCSHWTHQLTMQPLIWSEKSWELVNKLISYWYSHG